VVLVDRDEAALTALREKHGDAVIPLVIDLLGFLFQASRVRFRSLIFLRSGRVFPFSRSGRHLHCLFFWPLDGRFKKPANRLI
jgi:hypothetical protein